MYVCEGVHACIVCEHVCLYVCVNACLHVSVNEHVYIMNNMAFVTL